MVRMGIFRCNDCLDSGERFVWIDKNYEKVRCQCGADVCNPDIILLQRIAEAGTTLKEVMK